MSRYEQLMSMKQAVKDYQQELKELRASLPTLANARRILEIERRAQEMTIAARHFATQYGMAA